MSNNKKQTFDFRHLFLSSVITVAVAELIPAMFIGLLVVWQGYSFGSMPESYNFLQKGTYTIQELMKYGDFAIGLGILFAVGSIIYLSTIVIDEWIFSHKLTDLKNTLFYATVWAILFFVVDSFVLNGTIDVPTLSAISAGATLPITAMIFGIPVVMYFVRKKFSK